MRRIWLALGLLCVVSFFWVDYENKTDEWFAANERLRIGLPFSPWFDYLWWMNPIEGGGHTRLHLLSFSTVALIAGVLCLRQARKLGRSPKPEGERTP